MLFIVYGLVFNMDIDVLKIFVIDVMYIEFVWLFMMLFDEINFGMFKGCGVKLMVYYGMSDLVFLFDDMMDWY